MESELMIKQWNSNLKPRPRFGILGILKESYKTIKTSRKLMLQVLALVFFIFSNLDFAQVYLLEPVRKDFVSQLAKNPKLLQNFGTSMHESEYSGAVRDVREVLLVKFLFFTLSSIISLVFLVATVSSSSEAYTAKVQNLREVIMKIKKSWTKPTLTHFYMILMTIGSIFLFFLFMGMVPIFASGSWIFVIYGLLVLSLTVLWIYVFALWTMSLVVSVIEDVGGIDAIIRGKELMKGEKMKASLFVVLYYVAYCLVVSLTSSIRGPNLEKRSRMVISIVLTNWLLCALNLFVFVVFTIFYHEQKESCDEKAAKILYLPVVGDEEV